MPIPETMRVVETTEPGPDENLVIGERPIPVPTSDELLVRVTAAGVNRADVMQRKGNYPPPPGASDVLGLEISGVVASRGDGASGWSVGDRVCGIVTGGGYAEYCVIPSLQALPIPERVSTVAGAALPEACLTVWTNVFERGRLADGDTFLVHGGSSGIGTTAIQLARLSGARVFATAGSDEKCAACERLGAERAVNYRTGNFAAAIEAATQGRGVDVILDMVGAPYLQPHLDTLALEGRLVLIGLMGGAKAELNLLQLMSRRLSVTGSTRRSRAVAEKAALTEAVRASVWPWVSDGQFEPQIHKVFPFE